MPDKPDVNAAYSLHGTAQMTELYADWADSYDASFVQSRGYALHIQVADAFVQAGGSGPVLDVGAGTGVVGEALSSQGVTDIDGLDLSADMLRIAEKRGCYRALFTGDVTEDLALPKHCYGGVVSAGTFTLGHVGPEPLARLLTLLRPGGTMVIAVNKAHWRAAGFAAALDALRPRLAQVHMANVPIYAADADHDHAGDMGVLLTVVVP